MSKVIHKFELTSQWSRVIRLREEAEILDIAQQAGQVYLWAMLDLNLPEKDYEIVTVVTGGLIKDGLKYIKTVHMINAFGENLVLHYFLDHSHDHQVGHVMYPFYAEELGKDRIFHKDYHDGFYYELIDGRNHKITDPELGYNLVNVYTLKRHNSESE